MPGLLPIRRRPEGAATSMSWGGTRSVAPTLRHVRKRGAPTGNARAFASRASAARYREERNAGPSRRRSCTKVANCRFRSSGSRGSLVRRDGSIEAAFLALRRWDVRRRATSGTGLARLSGTSCAALDPGHGGTTMGRAAAGCHSRQKEGTGTRRIRKRAAAVSQAKAQHAYAQAAHRETNYGAPIVVPCISSG
jgi:hypothetical protein